MSSSDTDESFIIEDSVTQSQAKRRWIFAVRRISFLLRLRRKWARIGQWLNKEEVKDLTHHLERKKGKLRHKR